MNKAKIVLAPMNLANMPIQIVKALRTNGYEAEHVQYSMGQGHRFGYELDQEINVKELGGRILAHTKTLRSYIERDFDIFHFWNKSLFYRGDYSCNTGFDIPLLKARGKKVLFRFSGFDLRLPSKDKKVNPYSPFKYGYTHKFDEKRQQLFLDFLSEHVDQFLVQDPELQQFCPEAKLIPRALDLTEWNYVGIEKNDTPLVVHAPSNEAYKGTEFVLKAIEELQSESVNFDFKLITNMSHNEAKSWYEKADIVVDQLLIGSTGVLTLEAMALGKPVVLYLREELFSNFYDEIPVANANPDTITSVLRKLIGDYEWRMHLSKVGRKAIEDRHDIKKVIHQYIENYNTVLASDSTFPKGTKDLDYLAYQTQLMQGYEATSRRYKSQLDKLELNPSKSEEEQIAQILNMPKPFKEKLLKHLASSSETTIVERLKLLAGTRQ
jgi:glycosyltransferase involved in cell wall biosynthesis